MIFIVLVVLCSQRGDRYINLPGPPIFFCISFFFFRFKDKGSKRFTMTAPPAAGIPTYFLRPRKKKYVWAFFHIVRGENFKLYWIFFFL